MLKVRIACMALAAVVTSSSFASAGFFGRFSQRKSCGYSANVVYYPAHYRHSAPKYVICCQPQYVTPLCCDQSSSIVYDGVVADDCNSCSSSTSVQGESEVVHSDKHDVVDHEAGDEERPIDPKRVDEERPIDPKRVDEDETEAEEVEKPKKLEEDSKAAS